MENDVRCYEDIDICHQFYITHLAIRLATTIDIEKEIALIGHFVFPSYPFHFHMSTTKLSCQCPHFSPLVSIYTLPEADIMIVKQVCVSRGVQCCWLHAQIDMVLEYKNGRPHQRSSVHLWEAIYTIAYSSVQRYSTCINAISDHHV